jgi:hypothetical protein
MSLTPRQQGIYRPLVQRAWLAHCERERIAPDADGAYETWYRHEVREATGKDSTRDCDPTLDLDLLLIRFARIAGDDRMEAHATASAERRMRYVINELLGKLARAECRQVGWPYARAIYAQMSRYHMLPEQMEDCPAELLRKVVQALDTHLRRLRRRAQEVHHAA